MTSWSSRLDRLPRLGLVTGPSPLVPARRFSAASGGPMLWLKRDDLLPVALGGNKVRALDLIVADALDRGADTLITGAGPMSNHVRASATVAAMAGLRCTAVYWGTPPGREEGNLALTRMLGAEIRFTGEPDRASVDGGIQAAEAEVRARGGRPYGVPRGGACALAVLAHVLAVRETLAQCVSSGVMPGAVVLAAGGAATLGGWLLGSSLFGGAWRIEAIAVSRPAGETLKRATELAGQAAEAIGCRWNPQSVGATVHDGFLGVGYGVPSPEGQAAIVELARTEGIFLDPVYTGKAMAGYRQLRSEGRFDGRDSVLFLHTGGAPNLFVSKQGSEHV